MVNEAVFNGFESIKDLDGSNYPLMNYYVPATDATAIFVNDAVVITGESNANYVNGQENPPGTLATVKQAVPGVDNRVTGVVKGIIQGIAPAKVAGDIYRLASTEAILQVLVALPESLYRVRTNGTVVAGDVGQTLNITAAPAGDTATGISGMNADISSKGTAAGNQLKIVAVDNRVGNELGDYTDILVKFNNVTYGNAVAGV